MPTMPFRRSSKSQAHGSDNRDRESIYVYHSNTGEASAVHSPMVSNGNGQSLPLQATSSNNNNNAHADHRQGLGITSHLFSRKTSHDDKVDYIPSTVAPNATANTFGGRKRSSSFITSVTPNVPPTSSNTIGGTGSTESLYRMPLRARMSTSDLSDNSSHGSSLAYGAASPSPGSIHSPAGSSSDGWHSAHGSNVSSPSATPMPGDLSSTSHSGFTWHTNVSSARINSIYENPSQASSQRSIRSLRKKSTSPLVNSPPQRITPSMISSPVSVTYMSPGQVPAQAPYPPSATSGRTPPSGPIKKSSISGPFVSPISSSPITAYSPNPNGVGPYGQRYSVANLSHPSLPQRDMGASPPGQSPSPMQMLATKSSPSLSRTESYQRTPTPSHPVPSHDSRSTSPRTTVGTAQAISSPTIEKSQLTSTELKSSSSTKGNGTIHTPQLGAGAPVASPGSTMTTPSTSSLNQNFPSSPSLPRNSPVASIASSGRKDSVMSAGQQAETKNSTYTRSLNEHQRVNKEMWRRFQKFVSNSRQSDSLVYARTRKEAWLHSASLSKDPDLLELWLMMALRFLMKNQALFSYEGRARAKSVAQPYILDVQGVMKDFWAWQIAVDCPDAMVYGFKLDPTKTAYTSQPNNEGPPNYISFVGHSLAQLPFDDNFFDIVTAKSLWYLLKNFQWEFVFRELLRVLKPGGILELLCSDFTLLNRCPIDRYLFERFEQCVEEKQIEMRPSSALPSRLAKAGFKDIQRALVSLPRDWGGQIGTLTDLLSSYYMDSLVKHFSDYVPEEVFAIKGRSLMAADMGYHEAGIICLFSAVKPAA